MSINLIKSNNLFGFSVLNREEKKGGFLFGLCQAEQKNQNWMNGRQLCV